MKIKSCKEQLLAGITRSICYYPTFVLTSIILTRLKSCPQIAKVSLSTTSSSSFIMILSGSALFGNTAIGWYIIISWNVLYKNQIVVFKIKVTARVQNFIESLCVLYFLNHRSLPHQTRCADLLFTIAKPSTSKWAYIESSILTYSITRNTIQGWGVFCHARRQTFFFFVLLYYYFGESARDASSLRVANTSFLQQVETEPNCKSGKLFYNAPLISLPICYNMATTSSKSKQVQKN